MILVDCETTTFLGTPSAKLVNTSNSDRDLLIHWFNSDWCFELKHSTTFVCLRESANLASVTHLLKGKYKECQHTMTVKKFIKNVRRKSASTSNHHKRLPPPNSSSKTRWHIGRFKAAPYKSSKWLLANMPVSSVSRVQCYWYIFPLHDEAVKLPWQLKKGKIYKQTAAVITISIQ